jgi:hypothetical protein
MKTMDMPPYAPTLIESTRAIGYSLSAAVADLIDNSIAAKSNKVEISFFPVDEIYVSILDDGIGMDEDAINKAMQYGSKSPLDERESYDLGRFGLGLKTASLSQCRTLTVLSKQGKSVLGRRWDIDHVTYTGAWSLIVLEEDEIFQMPGISGLLEQRSGTLVVWQNLDRLEMGEIDFGKSFGRKMDEVRSHLELVYHRYLNGESGIKKLEILFNGQKIKPGDPFLSKRNTQAMNDEAIIVRGKRIVVRPFILPHISKMTEEEKETLGGKEGLRKQQGFYVYRNKRLLVWGTWFRMMRKGDMSKLARIMVDIPNDLDDLWTLDIKKSSAIPPAEVKSNLQSIVDNLADKSKRTWTFRGKKEISDNVQHVWTRLKCPGGGVLYELNRNHPLFTQLSDEVPQIKRKIESLLKHIERSIPLNQLYVDLNNDEKIENDGGIDSEDIIQAFEMLLAGVKNPIERFELIERLEYTEPFCNFPDVIQCYKKGE